MRPTLSCATGVGVYLQNMVKALTELDEENHYFLFSSSWQERFPKTFYGKNFSIRDRHWPVKILNYTWNHFAWPTIESLVKARVNVAHSPSPLLIPSKGARSVTMVHDLYFYFHPEHTVREIRRDYPALVRKHCQQSDAIIAVSESTKQQLVEHLRIPASKIYTIRHGADPFFIERAPSERLAHVKQKFGIQRPYFLFVGALEPRKNLTRLLAAFRALREDVQLVLAGPEGWLHPDWNDLPTDRVIRTGYVSKEELRALYQQAIALVLPSLEEGFGLPLMEAMASETSVLASRIPVFQEVGNDCYLACDSNRVDELLEGMKKLYSDSEFRQTLIEKGKERIKGFSWRETAQKTLDIYNNL